MTIQEAIREAAKDLGERSDKITSLLMVEMGADGSWKVTRVNAPIAVEMGLASLAFENAKASLRELRAEGLTGIKETAI